MTRTEQFSASVEQPLLQMKNEVENLNIDDLDDNQRLEFARAKKVFKYIENYINLLDPDLLPQTFYTQMQSKIQSWNKTISHLNQILDEILFYIASYSNIYIPKNQTSSIISEMISDYSHSIKQSLQEINFNKIKKDAKAIENYENKLLSANNSIQSQIANSQIQIQTWFNEIKKFNDDFFVKQEGKDVSIKAEIEHIQNDMALAYKQFHDTMINFTPKLTDIDEFYVKIFGAMENNQRVGGLQQKIKDRQKQLDEYDEEQKAKFKSLKDEIESLLKDATNASLASSYEKSKESYKWAIYGWNVAFFFAIFAIIGVTFWGFMETISQLKQNQVLDSLLSILMAILIRLPFYIPLAWLAIFSTQRRNESKRLQEEYKHKETLARSFLGYKKQIDEIQSDLSQDNIDLAKRLMTNLVEMTNENPNKSLDKIKKENMPMIEFFEKLSKSSDEIKNLFKDFISIFKKAQ